MHNIANIVTGSRIALSIAMVVAHPFSWMFWICYVWCGLSDIIDGQIARKMHQESSFGAKLDSIADAVFAMALGLIVILNIRISLWFLIGILVIALIRISSYGIGFYKYHTFASLHTLANKVTGALLFGAPVLYVVIGFTATAWVLCIIAFISSVEEWMITIRSTQLNRDCKGYFRRI